MSSAGSYGSGGSGMAGVITITGDFGPSVTGNVLLTGGTSGGIFTGSGGNTLTMSFNFLDLPATDNPLTQGYISFNGNPTIALYGGNSNMYVGVNAGNVAQSGLQCVGVGQSALQSGAANSDETAIGYSALRNANGTVGNTAIGANSLVSNTNSDYNTAVGLQAIVLLTSTTGDGNNVAVGYNSLGNLLTGTDNIAIGTQAGSLYNAAEDSNIVIGNDGTTGDTNTIRIGTQGTGAAEQDTTFIAGIYGSTVGGTNAAVFIDNTGKLGTLGGGGASILTLTGDSGGAVGPSGGGNINILGSGALSVVGNPGTNTLTASLSGAVVTTYATDTANVTPSANTLNLFGGTGITTASSPNTVTFNLTSPVSIAHGGTNATSMTNTYGVNYYDGTSIVTTTVGTAGQVLTSNGAGVAPTFQAAAGGGVTTLAGDAGATASGAVTITGGSSGAIFTESGGNTLTESFGFLSMTDTNGAGTTGIIEIGGSTVFAMYGGVANTNVIIGPTAGAAAMSSVDNTACGAGALNGITSGNSNVAVGSGSLNGITSGSGNVACGTASLNALTTSTNNCAIGTSSLINLVTGTRNIAVGTIAGNAYTSSESHNIVIGNTGTAADANTIRIGTEGTGTGQQNLCFIAGIANATVTGSAVLVDTGTGQLGLVVSSERYKENIQDMGADSHAIMSLRPAKFSFKHDPTKETQYGLIAEEVHKVMPYLVTYDKEGKPYTVKYHELPSLLLNEIQRLEARIKSLEEQFAARVR